MYKQNHKILTNNHGDDILVVQSGYAERIVHCI